ncbi:MAG: glutamate formimidoyltransferase [Dethiobacteria bacterium]|nr:glutamate formimidoyltransferase [Dethiobacteria bacterium]
MAKIVQCVPNFSEGRRVEIVEQIVASIAAVRGIKILDYSYDESHNRSVITFIGEPEAVLEGAFQGARQAAELIDMAKHSGGHPRMGATDVIPFIPVAGVSMEDCVNLAKRLGERIAGELAIPVYLYEAAASKPERKNLSDLRRGQYEGLIEAIKEPDRKPDFGPAAVNLQAGVTAVGARSPLIAYNINLDTADKQVAGNIARAIRGSSGGFPSIKALGLIIEETGNAQVTINVCDYKQVPLHRVFELVKREAARYGVAVTGSEVVGLVPLDALVGAAEFYLQFSGFERGQVLENRLLE